MTANRSYPRWRKSGYSELYYPYKERWVYEVHHGSEHPDGRFVAVGKDFHERFSTAQEAKDCCEALYAMEHARLQYDFPREHIPRPSRRTQEITLPCPILNNRVRHGWLSIRWNPKSASPSWDYADFDACYPDCERFKLLLAQSNWDRELIRRLIQSGWRWYQIERTSTHWNRLRGVPLQVAEWILNTLPGVYARACDQYAQACALVPTQDWYRHRKKAPFEPDHTLPLPGQ